jgi:tocopherol cyclase
MKTYSYLPRLFRPAVYQGKRNPSGYFEGWYFKLVSHSEGHIWGIIPGISYATDPHSFIQVIHANSGHTWYIRYALEDFRFSRREFNVRVGPNEFSYDGLHLDLHDDDLSIRGSLYIVNPVPFPSSLTAPGIMGWYSYVPFMECYHGVVSMQHRLSGVLRINGPEVSFHGGKGYIEKDWGTSMPSDWIWMQSNHFKQDDTASFMLSVARIPWLKGFFPGFLSFLLAGGKLYRFATYNHSVVRTLEVDPDQVNIFLYNRKYSLRVRVMRLDGGILKAPRHGNMDREIKESIISTMNIELKDRTGRVIFKDSGQYAGLEIVGDVQQYFPKND